MVDRKMATGGGGETLGEWLALSVLVTYQFLPELLNSDITRPFLIIKSIMGKIYVSSNSEWGEANMGTEA